MSGIVTLALSFVFLAYLVSGTSLNDLHLSKIDFNVAQGKFISSTVVGIYFTSTSTSLNISDLSGNNLLVVHKTLQNQQWVTIQKDVFVQVYVSATKNYQDFYVPKYIYNDATTITYLNDTGFQLLNTLSSYYHSENLRRAVSQLLESPYATTITAAAYYLGVHFKLKGNIYPSLLPFYLVANMLEKLQNTTVNGYTRRDSQYRLTHHEEDCLTECPPCPDDECLSLCGYGCHCWKWVCGDCCYHLGCYGHDVCCRNNFIQTKCLFPISFKCESEYDC